MSLDDFYILGSGLVMLQTTNSVFNETLIKQVVPESLLAWQRVRIANMMANDGKTWAETFSKCNSGEYTFICPLGKKMCSLSLLYSFPSLGRTCNCLSVLIPRNLQQSVHGSRPEKGQAAEEPWWWCIVHCWADPNPCGVFWSNKCSPER